MGRSSVCSLPAPLIRHGFAPTTPSSAAVAKMACSTRYALDDTDFGPARSNSRYQLRTASGVTFDREVTPNVGKMYLSRRY
jgi:hypothetical protein